MSAFGTKRTCQSLSAMSAFDPKRKSSGISVRPSPNQYGATDFASTLSSPAANVGIPGLLAARPVRRVRRDRRVVIGRAAGKATRHRVDVGHHDRRIRIGDNPPDQLQRAAYRVGEIIVRIFRGIDAVLTAAMRLPFQQPQFAQQLGMIRQSHQAAGEQRDALEIDGGFWQRALAVIDSRQVPATHCAA